MQTIIIDSIQRNIFVFFTIMYIIFLLIYYVDGRKEYINPLENVKYDTNMSRLKIILIKKKKLNIFV